MLQIDVRADVVREAAVSGAFYAMDSSELKNSVDRFLFEVGNKKLMRVKPMGLVVPHAGYIYSGSVAAYAYKELEMHHYDTVVIIGLSHHKFISGASIYKKGKFKTPLGLVDIDESITEKLFSLNKNFIFDEDAHLKEHSIEVQLPFLQRILKDFKIVPILINNADPKNCENLADTISKVIKGKNVLIIGSSDLSHYPKYDDAVKIDRIIANAIEKMDVNELENKDKLYMSKGISNLNCTLCGDAAVKTTIMLLKFLGANNGRIMKLANSGDSRYGEKDRVVGYTSIAFWKESKDDDSLTEDEGRKLLKLSRETLISYIKGCKIPEVSFKEPKLNEKRGVFVTLRKKDVLRGCIGYIEGITPLVDAVKKMTIASSTEDPRFPAVSQNEIKDIKIEISVLSPIKRIKSAEDIVLGKHGVIVKNGFNSGVFLPQVATETGWSKEEFLSHLCSDKAGLSKDAWKHKDTEIYVFTAQIFEED